MNVMPRRLPHVTILLQSISKPYASVVLDSRDLVCQPAHNCQIRNHDDMLKALE